jgi:antitoxin component HigA of HigAB toxin-antitoxin module
MCSIMRSTNSATVRASLPSCSRSRSRSRASEVLARKRALTIDMIHKIGEAWKIPADLLVRPYKIEKAA